MLPKRTVWLKDLGRDLAGYGTLKHSTFKVIKTQNTLKPSIGDTLDSTEVAGLIERQFTVNIS